eukprot:scaffold1355_cov268-Pinguiococcus_pyrenoidosus.AAC.92
MASSADLCQFVSEICANAELLRSFAPELDGQDASRGPEAAEAALEGLSHRRLLIRVLNFMLHDDRSLLENALRLLDRGRIRKVCAEKSGRSFFSVASGHQSFSCFSEYCSCKTFVEAAKESPRPFLCAHLLATKIATAWGVLEVDTVSDSTFSAHLSKVPCPGEA